MNGMTGGAQSMSPAGNATFQMMVSKMNGDMKFVGMFSIIYGAIVCIGIITALIGVPMIIAGLRLREAANSFTVYLNSNNSIALQQGFERQSRYFFIQKVFIIIGLVVFGLYLLIALIAIIGASSSY
jgi:hypothetical protein